MMKRIVSFVCGGLLVTTAVAVGPAGAAGSTLCVGSGPRCYASIQAALRAASDGDTIRIDAGTYAGGVRINKSVRVVGAGAHRTVIRGGGPVLTIGRLEAARQPTVSIAALTVTGGRTQGDDGVFAFGGGILVPYGKDFSPGATVNLRNIIVTRNIAAATKTSPSPSGVQCPHQRDCPFALSAGGGIANFGTMSLRDTVVSHNAAAGIASDAYGGAIFSALGDLSLQHSAIRDNHAAATIPNGRYAEGGGMFVGGGNLSIRNSRVRGNVASLRSRLPAKAGGEVIEMSANGGGLHVGGDVANTFVGHTTIKSNVARAINRRGEPLAFDAGMLVGSGRLVMRHSLVTANKVLAISGTVLDAGGSGSGSALEVTGAGLIVDSRITDNPSIARSPDGYAQVSAGLAVFNFDGDPKLVVVRRSVIAANAARAVSNTGQAAAYAGGILNNSLLKLSHVVVRHNTGRAVAPDATAQGGGIWNGVLYSGPPVELTLRDTRVVANSLSGNREATRQGGGLYTTQPVTRASATIARNTPDDCYGCSAASARTPGKVQPTIVDRSRFSGSAHWPAGGLQQLLAH
jgi:hypothetical protein